MTSTQWVIAGAALALLLFVLLLVARRQTTNALLLFFGAIESGRRLYRRIRGKTDPVRPEPEAPPAKGPPRSFGLLTISDYIERRDREREVKKP